jgi:hypothetical protein
MQISTQRCGDPIGDQQRYRLAEAPAPCCPTMAAALSQRSIVFGTGADDDDSPVNTLSLVAYLPWRRADGTVARDSAPITHCPFCGDPIVLHASTEG